MRLRVAGAALLLAASYYVYVPLPGGVSEPWKLMLLDALFRSFMRASDVAHSLGVCHRLHMLNRVVSWVEDVAPRSCPAVEVADSSLGGVPTRVFTPRGGGARPKRGVVYFHGGGWALGSGRMRSYDLLCRKMAEDLDAVVMSVDYRLAPDAVFPDQFYDALAAARDFLSPEVLDRYGMDPDRLAVSGDSAGGNLAAAVAQELGSDESQAVRFKVQALIYPVLQALDFHTPSYQQNQAVPILYRPYMARFWLHYLGADPSLAPVLLANNHTALDQSERSKLDWTVLLPPERRKNFLPVVRATASPRVMQEVPQLTDVRAAPLLAEPAVLRRTPAAAYVMTCEFDVLRDDGLMYARRLRDAGVAVTSDHYEDGFHGCMVFSFLPMRSEVGRRSMDNYIRWLDQNL